MGTADSRRLGSDAEALLEQGRWVRALARKLVGDVARAEDVTQETWLAAWKQGPGDAEVLRPWLVRVVTNFAREMRRGDKNRKAREKRAARAESLPSTSETAERLELQRALLDALEAIDEPYRTTIRLRYFDGLSAAHIARQAGVPAGTVRWRLKRGLELLRERLDGRFGGNRRAWCIAFLPLLQRPPVLESAAASLSALPGVWFMSAILKTALVGALALSATLVVWNVASDRDPIAPPKSEIETGVLVPSAKSSLPPAASAELASVAADSQRGEVAVVASEPKVELAPTPELETQIDARFVDSNARGLVGVKFRVTGDIDEQHVESSIDGSARLLIALRGEASISRVDAAVDGYATWFHGLVIVRGNTVNLGEIVLEPGGAVAGVVLGRDGAPVAGATVLVTRPELELNREMEDARRLGPEMAQDAPTSLTQPDGTFRVDGVPAKVVRVWAGAPGMRYSVSPPIELLPHQVHAGITLTLEPLSDDDTIRGIVLAPDGSPVREARITYSYRSKNESGTSSFVAGEDGRFELKLLKKVPHDFSARDMEERWPTVGRLAVAPGTHDLVLAFSEARMFELAVSRDGGKPVESFSVRLRSADDRREIAKREAQGHERGKMRLEAPGQPFVLYVSAKGMTKERVGPFDAEHVPDTVHCALKSLPGVHGRVVRGKTPVSHATVSLYEMATSDERIDHNSFLTRLRPPLIETDVSDEEGRFWFTVREAETYAILCDADGSATAELSPLEIDPAEGMSGLEIEMSSGGSVEGRVRVKAGRDPAGILVAANRFDSHPRFETVGSDGMFRFEHLTPGKWEVTQTAYKFSPHSSSTSSQSGDGIEVRYTPNCEVHEGRVTRFDLDLTDVTPVALAGSVMVNGKPALGWTAELWPADPKGPRPARARGAVDGSGRLSVELSEPGTYHVALHAPKEIVPEVVIETDLALARGANPWIVDLAVGAIEGRLAAPNSRARLNYEWKGESGLSASISIPIDGASFRADLLPAGKGELVCWIDEPGDQPDHDLSRIAIDVPRGGVRQVDVP